MLMKRILATGILSLVTAGAARAAIVTGPVIFSDNFNRADSSTELGKTDQGYTWVRQSRGAVGVNGPGIKDNQLYWEGNATGVTDPISPQMGFDVRDFVLDMDFTGGDATHGTTIAFRMPSLGKLLADGGSPAGYEVRIFTIDATHIKMQLVSNYANPTGGPTDRTTLVEGTVTTTSTSTLNSIRLTAVGNEFAGYVRNARDGWEQAFAYTDGTNNPSALQGGQFTFSANKLRTIEFDNLTVYSVPEPAGMCLLVPAAILLLGQRIRMRQRVRPIRH